MLRSYVDILEKINSEPQWWDRFGVPRFCIFSPEFFDIHAQEAALIAIKCQGCLRDFDVEVIYDKYELRTGRSDLIDYFLSKNPKEIFYGDPPRIDCCMSGPTMSSIPIEIKNLWSKKSGIWQEIFELRGFKLSDSEEYGLGDIVL